MYYNSHSARRKQAIQLTMCHVVDSVQVAVSILVHEVLSLAFHDLEREAYVVQSLRGTESATLF